VTGRGGLLGRFTRALAGREIDVIKRSIFLAARIVHAPGRLHRDVVGDVEREAEIKTVLSGREYKSAGEVDRVRSRAQRREHDEVTVGNRGACGAFRQPEQVVVWHWTKVEKRGVRPVSLQVCQRLSIDRAGEAYRIISQELRHRAAIRLVHTSFSEGLLRVNNGEKEGFPRGDGYVPIRYSDQIAVQVGRGRPRASEKPHGPGLAGADGGGVGQGMCIRR